MPSLDTEELIGKKDEKSVLELALKRFKQVNEAEFSTRTGCLDDLKFSTLDQWPEDIKKDREGQNKPCLVMDQTTQTIRIVGNEYRLKRPALNFSPVGDGADTDSAEIIQGMARHVEVRSDAEIAYDTSHEFVTRIGFGSWRFLTEYVDEKSDDQEICIEAIRNPFSVYWQPGVPTKKAIWCFIIEDVPREQYQQDYPDSTYTTSDFSEYTATGNSSPEWVTKETVRVAEYFTIEMREVEGSKRKKKQVVWRKINATEVLDGPTDLPGDSIPIFTATGDDIDVDGKRYLAGLIRPAVGPQRMANYWFSAATEKIALAKTAPWTAVEGSIVDEKAWENPDGKRVLYYRQVDVGGKAAPPPQRELLDPRIDALTTMTTMSQAAVKSAMGVYDPSLGQRKGDESGKAIEHLQTQGSLATVNFSENVAREMKRSGYVLIDWMRFYYPEPRIQRIIMPDGTQKQVVIHNGPDQAQAAQKMFTDKITKAFDISVGRYDVTVSVDKGYQTKRQEATDTQLELMKVLGPQAQFVTDIAVRNMDIPQSKEIADRLKKMLPQQLQDDQTDPEAALQQAQHANAHLDQQLKLATQALQDAQKVVETKQIEAQNKFDIAKYQEDSAFALAKLKIDAQVLIAQITTKSQEVMTRDKMQTAVWQETHGAAHDLGLQKDQQAHEQTMGAQQAAVDQQSQAADQSHEATMTAANQSHEQQMAEQQQENSNGE